MGSTSFVCGNTEICIVFSFRCSTFPCHTQNQNAHSAYLTFDTCAKLHNLHWYSSLQLLFEFTNICVSLLVSYVWMDTQPFWLVCFISSCWLSCWLHSSSTAVIRLEYQFPFNVSLVFQSTVQNPATSHPCASLCALTHHQEHTHFIHVRVCSSSMSFPGSSPKVTAGWVGGGDENEEK